jgi:hypothetical protein
VWQGHRFAFVSTISTVRQCDIVCFFTLYKVRIGFMVFNATFNNIAVISWQSVLLVEETGVPGENHRPVASD